MQSRFDHKRKVFSHPSNGAAHRGLDRDAGDYLTKPFDLGEVSARVKALLRRGRSGMFAPWSALLGLGVRKGPAGDQPLALSMVNLRLTIRVLLACQV